VYLIVGVIALALTIYAVIDCALAYRERVRALPKPLWILIIIVIAPIGGILWFTLGKERRSPVAVVSRTAPDDDPAFLRRLAEDAEREERIRRLEAQLAELDDDHPDRGRGDGSRPDAKD